MRATLLYGVGDVRVEGVAVPKIQNPTDAVVRVVLSCICGSDLWPCKSAPRTDDPRHGGMCAAGQPLQPVGGVQPVKLRSARRPPNRTSAEAVGRA